MTVTEILQQYLAEISRGLIKLSEQEAANIVKIITSNADKIYSVVLMRYNGQKNLYEPIRTISTTLADIEAVKAKLKVQWKGFYRYDCTDPDGNCFDMLYTLSPSLFD